MTLQEKISFQDKYSIQNLCNSCNHQSCCIDFASPLVYSHDLKKLKSMGKQSDEFLTEVTIKGKKVKTIKKKTDGKTCTFWDEDYNRCSIYQYRPFDCKLYPFDIYLINGEFHWIVYSCNPKSNWEWSEAYLQELENDPQFGEIMENIDTYSDLAWTNTLKDSQKPEFSILRKVRRSIFLTR